MVLETLPNNVQYFKLSADLGNIVEQFVGFFVNISPGYYAIIFIVLFILIFYSVFANLRSFTEVK